MSLTATAGCCAFTGQRLVDAECAGCVVYPLAEEKVDGLNHGHPVWPRPAGRPGADQALTPDSCRKAKKGA